MISRPRASSNPLALRVSARDVEVAKGEHGNSAVAGRGGDHVKVVDVTVLKSHAAV